MFEEKSRALERPSGEGVLECETNEAVVCRATRLVLAQCDYQSPKANGLV